MHLIPLQSPIQVAHKQLLVLTYRTHRLLLAIGYIPYSVAVPREQEPTIIKNLQPKSTL